MALIECKECKAKVSTDAKACPSCGAKMPKRTSTLTWVISGFFLVAAVLGIASSNTQRQADETAEAAKSPAQKASEAAAKAADTNRFSAARATSAGLKQAAREPESVKFESLRVSEDGSVICTEFRGRNGFGGMTKEHIVVVKGKPDNSAAGWNRQCPKSMYDYLFAVE